MRFHLLRTLAGCLLMPYLARPSSCIDFNVPYLKQDPTKELGRLPLGSVPQAAVPPAWQLPDQNMAFIGGPPHKHGGAEASGPGVITSLAGSNPWPRTSLYDPLPHLYDAQNPSRTLGYHQPRTQKPTVPGQYGGPDGFPTSARWLNSSAGRLTAALRARVENLAQGLGSSQDEYRSPLDLLVEEFLVFVKSINRVVAMCESSKTGALFPSSAFTSEAENAIVNPRRAEQQAKNVVNAARPVLVEAAGLLNLLYRAPSESALRDAVKRFTDKLETLRSVAQNFRIQMQAIRGAVRSKLVDCPILLKSMGKRNTVQDLWMKTIARLNSIAKYITLAGEKLPPLLFLLLPAVHGNVQPESTADFRLTDKVAAVSELIDTIQSRANSSKAYNEKLQKAIIQLTLSGTGDNGGPATLSAGQSGPYGVLGRTGYFSDSFGGGGGPMASIFAGRPGTHPAVGVLGGSMGSFKTTTSGGVGGPLPLGSSLGADVRGSAAGLGEHPPAGFGLGESQFADQLRFDAAPKSLLPLLPGALRSPAAVETGKKPVELPEEGSGSSPVTEGIEEAFPPSGPNSRHARVDYENSPFAESLQFPYLSADGSGALLRESTSLPALEVSHRATSSAVAGTPGKSPGMSGLRLVRDPTEPSSFGTDVAVSGDPGAEASTGLDSAMAAEAKHSLSAEKGAGVAVAEPALQRELMPTVETPAAGPLAGFPPEALTLTGRPLQSPLLGPKLTGPGITMDVDGLPAPDTDGEGGALRGARLGRSSGMSPQASMVGEEDVSNDLE